MISAALGFLAVAICRKILPRAMNWLSAVKWICFRGGDKWSIPSMHEFITPAGEAGLLHTGGVVPLYTSSADMKERGLRSRGFRRLMRGALDEFVEQVADRLPAQIRTRQQLMPLVQALRTIHFPASLTEAENARRRLAFDELFYLQLRLARLRARRRERPEGIAMAQSEELVPQLMRPALCTDGRAGARGE